MDTHEQPLQSESPTNTANVPLDAARLKNLMLTAAEAIPTKLPPGMACWWEKQPSRPPALTKAIGDVIHHPPILRDMVESWRRFYAMMFNSKIPNINEKTWNLDQLADGFILVCKSLVRPESIFRLWCNSPAIFNPDNTTTMLHINWQDVGKNRDYLWYLICIEPITSRGHFEHGEDESGILFEELFLQQLYEYWLGKPLSRSWLYADGSRVEGDLVPAIRWADNKMVVQTFHRRSIKKNMWYTSLSAKMG